MKYGAHVHPLYIVGIFFYRVWVAASFFLFIRTRERYIREVVACCRGMQTVRESQKPTSSYISLFLPSPLLSYSSGSFLFWPFILRIAPRRADPRAECIYRRLYDSRNSTLKNLRTCEWWPVWFTLVRVYPKTRPELSRGEIYILRRLRNEFMFPARFNMQMRWEKNINVLFLNAIINKRHKSLKSQIDRRRFL